MSARIYCGERGCPESERWSSRWTPSTEDRARLAILAAEEVLEVQPSPGDQLRVAGLDACGRIRLPSGCHIEVRSKIPLAQLIDWLAFTETVPELDGWTDDPLLRPDGDSLVDALALLFVSELARLTQFHWRPGYVRVSEATASFRGRVDARRLGRSAARLPALPCVYRDRTMDTLANRVLARALDAIWRLADVAAFPEPGRRSLAWLTRQWSDIDRMLPSINQALADVLSAPPIGYRRALRLARLVLKGGRIDAIRGDGGDIFLVRMSAVWEEGVRRILAGWAVARGIAIGSDKDRTRRWEDSSGDDPTRWLTVDALVVTDRPFVLDAKYKRGYGDESRGDRFQMAAYAMAFGAYAAILVYPTAAREARHRRLMRTALPGVDSDILSLELPMALGPAACAKAAHPSFDEICR